MALPRTARTGPPPVMEARRWIAGLTFPTDRPLLNVSQAAPVKPPPLPLRTEMARLVTEVPEAHLYGPVLGLPALREEIARQWSADYAGHVSPAQVAVTAGCNEAFAAAMSCLADAGDEVILPTPFYFNHAMWCEMEGLRILPVPARAGLLPDPGEAAALITPRTRAIVLVSPNNPAGVEYPDALVRAFYDLARDRGIALVLDETYRDFDSRSGPPHDLFSDPDWSDTLVQLYSFSKTYRLTGHRVGAMVASGARLAEAEKFLDTVTICAPQLGQHAALWGMRNLAQWRAGERAEILDRRAAMEEAFATLPGWTLLGSGAYFAYARHPWDLPSDIAAERLVSEAGVLMLPGTMFRPRTDPQAAREMRIAFANVDRAGITILRDRLAAATLT